MTSSVLSLKHAYELSLRGLRLAGGRSNLEEGCTSTLRAPMKSGRAMTLATNFEDTHYLVTSMAA